MDKLQSLKETVFSRYCVPLTGFQIDLFTFILKSIIDETLIVDGKKFASDVDTPPRFYFRMIAWSLLYYLNCIHLMDSSDV